MCTFDAFNILDRLGYGYCIPFLYELQVNREHVELRLQSSVRIAGCVEQILAASAPRYQRTKEVQGNGSELLRPNNESEYRCNISRD